MAEAARIVDARQALADLNMFYVAVAASMTEKGGAAFQKMQKQLEKQASGE